MSDLYEKFRQNFEIVDADTAELREHVFRLRYQILCVEKRLPDFDSVNCPNQMEKDNYDEHSAHILLRCRASNEFIGTVRLILNDASQPKKKLPIELFGHPDRTLCDIQSLPKNQTAEISRLLVTTQFDRRKEDRRKQETRNDGNRRNEDERRAGDRRASLDVVLMMAAGVMRMSAKYQIENWLSVMDPALNRLLSFYGLELTPIGPLINYHGLRRPYFVKVSEVVARMFANHRAAWEIVTGNGKYSYDPK